MQNVTAQFLNDHVRLVERSRALHLAIASKIRGNPGLIDIARQNLQRWLSDERAHGQVSAGLLEWQKILQRATVNEIVQLLSDSSEEADRLRHATPFCGILTEAERQSIYQQHAPIPA